MAWKLASTTNVTLLSGIGLLDEKAGASPLMRNSPHSKRPTPVPDSLVLSISSGLPSEVSRRFQSSLSHLATHNHPSTVPCWRPCSGARQPSGTVGVEQTTIAAQIGRDGRPYRHWLGLPSQTSRTGGATSREAKKSRFEATNQRSVGATLCRSPILTSPVRPSNVGPTCHAGLDRSAGWFSANVSTSLTPGDRQADGTEDRCAERRGLPLR